MSYLQEIFISHSFTNFSTMTFYRARQEEICRGRRSKGDFTRNKYFTSHAEIESNLRQLNASFRVR